MLRLTSTINLIIRYSIITQNKQVPFVIFYLKALVVTLMKYMTVSHFQPLSGSEDFAYYLTKTPGTFYIVGAKPEGVEEPYPDHHPKFIINEDTMLVCAKSLG